MPAADATSGRAEAGRVADCFTEVLERSWERLAPLLGGVATAAVLRSTRRSVEHDHPLLAAVEADGAGLRLGRLRPACLAAGPAACRAACVAFVDALLALLVDLTGDILAARVAPIVDEARARLGEEVT